MKTRIILFLIFAGVITLSFTFATVKNSQRTDAKQNPSKEAKSEPVGGFVSADQL